MIVIFDVDGVIRDVANSYRRALADTVETFTAGAYRPSVDEIDALKAEGQWNNDWEASQELIYRYFEQQGQPRPVTNLQYETIVAFFQSRYRGEVNGEWTGYICHEPLLASRDYFDQLTQAQIGWGFFSGATRGSARYVLERRMGLAAPVLVAMEDAPGKPDPTGLFAVAQQLDPLGTRPVVYVGDTVADMYTIQHAREHVGDRPWIAVGVLPPHVQTDPQRQTRYSATLQQAGAKTVVDNVQELTPSMIEQLCRDG
jgi:HAD superfamily phosphatase